METEDDRCQNKYIYSRVSVVPFRRFTRSLSLKVPNFSVEIHGHFYSLLRKGVRGDVATVYEISQVYTTNESVGRPKRNKCQLLISCVVLIDVAGEEAYHFQPKLFGKRITSAFLEYSKGKC